jgi:hypothetical protein
MDNAAGTSQRAEAAAAAATTNQPTGGQKDPNRGGKRVVGEDRTKWVFEKDRTVASSHRFKNKVSVT